MKEMQLFYTETPRGWLYIYAKDDDGNRTPFRASVMTFGEMYFVALMQAEPISVVWGDFVRDQDTLKRYLFDWCLKGKKPSRRRS